MRNPIRTISLIMLVASLSLALFVSHPAAGRAAADQAATLAATQADKEPAKNDDKPIPSCAFVPETIEGQANSYIVGSGGTITPNLPPGASLVDAGAWVKSFSDTTWMTNLNTEIAGGELPKRSVDLLIMDDFTDSAKSHGFFVEAVAQGVLAAAQQVLQAQSLPVHILEVNVGKGYNQLKDTQEMTTTLNNFLQKSEFNPTDQFAVLNMSFVLLPCVDDKSKFDATYFLKSGTTLYDYLKSSGSSLDLSQYSDLALDPLKQYIDNFSVNHNGVPLDSFAAAGNFGPKYPSFYPAMWPSVVSVGASTADGSGNYLTLPPPQTVADPRVWPQSNQSKDNVYEPGSWWNVKVGGVNYYIDGTSFSSPAQSVIHALSLLP